MKKILSITVLVTVAVSAMMAFKPVKPSDTAGTKKINKPAPLASRWVFDKPHTNILFSVSHLVVSDVEGKFKNFDGSVESDKPDFSDAKISFTVDVNSISTDNDMRDNHLKSDDFFNAAKFPQMKFESTSFQPLGGNKYKLMGNLTIRDVTKPVTFDVTFGGLVNAMGGTHAGFKAKTTINRFDYNLKFSATTETGGLVVGKDVDITINVDIKKS
ncbi:MAG TPA: YceI family protein [Puia sp.]|nr:YceI family protein [Puia sp.]